LYFSTSDEEEENGSVKKTGKKGQFAPIPALEINEKGLPCNSPSSLNGVGRGRKSKVWSSGDEDVFMRAYTEYGSSWRDIQRALPDKTREQIQSHIQYLLRTGKIEDKGVKHRKRRKKDFSENNNGHTMTTSSNTDKE